MPLIKGVGVSMDSEHRLLVGLKRASENTTYSLTQEVLHVYIS